MKTCILVLDNLRSVENTASIFRTADGLGVGKIYLVGTTPAPLDRFGRSRADFHKVALGAELSVSWEYVRDMEPVVYLLRERGVPIIALEQHESSVELKGFEVPEKFALIVGNEVGGVSEHALESSSAIIEIPMRGQKESLNVSVSTGIALYALLNA